MHTISFHFIPFMGILAYKKEREEEGGGSVCVCVSKMSDQIRSEKP